MVEPREFYYEPDPGEQLSTEVVTAIAEAHDEDVIDQKWRISDDIDTDALDMLFADHEPDMTLQFDADMATVTIIADENGAQVIKIRSHR